MTEMQQESDPPFALTYRDGNDYYFIPVAPVPAKKWRGPFASELALSHALWRELGDGRFCRHAHDRKTRLSAELRFNETVSLARRDARCT
jgi:hypothetical protein